MKRPNVRNASEIGKFVRHRSVRNYQGVCKTPDFGRCSDGVMDVNEWLLFDTQEN